ncbi:hypothetical protein XarCFBP6771_02605 [Xanthomonas arboricola]|nr:hypothetical protein XarCFBP6771_02605 [Xanthomonas arboricola]
MIGCPARSDILSDSPPRHIPVPLSANPRPRCCLGQSTSHPYWRGATRLPWQTRRSWPQRHSSCPSGHLLPLGEGITSVQSPLSTECASARSLRSRPGLPSTRWPAPRWR